MGFDSHNYVGRLRLAKRKIEEDAAILASNKEHIRRFLEFNEARGLAPGRLTKLAWTMRLWGHSITVDFKDATKDDIVTAVRGLEDLRTPKGLPYKPHTRSDMKAILKQHYRWLFGCDRGECPKVVSWVTTGFRRARMAPEDLLSREEADRMIGACRDPMEKAFVAVLYETGARIGEMLSIRLRDISHDSLGFRIQVEGKVGHRGVRVITSSVYLGAWIAAHPRQADGDAALWLNRLGRPLQNSPANTLIKRLATAAGIHKRVYPYLCRHSSITAAAPHLRESVLKEVFGWTQSSKMPAVYVHLSNRDVDAALLRMHGREAADPADVQRPASRICPRCSTENHPADQFCGRCGTPVDPGEVTRLRAGEGASQRADRILEEVLEDPRLRELLSKRVAEIAGRGPAGNATPAPI